MRTTGKISLAILCLIICFEMALELLYVSKSTKSVQRRKLIPEKTLKKVDSLFYGVDIKTEQRQSIQGGSISIYRRVFLITNWHMYVWISISSFISPHFLCSCEIGSNEPYPYRTNKYQTALQIYPAGSRHFVKDTFRNIFDVYDKRLKSGTSDLFQHIIKHPQVIPGAVKEPMWWNRKRIGNAQFQYHTWSSICRWDCKGTQYLILNILFSITQVENGNIL